jgi:hypothetical protein
VDSKITLSFDEGVIRKAKKFAEDNNISLSRLTEMLLRKVTSSNYQNLEDGLEFYSALGMGCVCIVTEDNSDFHFSTIEVLSAEHFLKQHAFN